MDVYALRMLSLDKLAALAAVHRHGSFSAAARALHLTQPSISRQVAHLERQLGTRLLERDRRGVRPTEAGQVLLTHTQAILDRLALAEAQVHALTGPPRGRVRVGSFFSALVHLSPEAGALLAEQHPDIVIVDELADPATAITRLARGELDLAIIFDHDFAPTPVPETLHARPLFDDPVRVLLAADHPRAGDRAIDLADLEHDVWIRAHDGTAAQLTDHVLARTGLRPPLLYAGRGDEPVETQALVAAGRGIALTYDLTVLVSDHRLAVRPTTEHVASRRILAAHPDGPIATAPAAVLQALAIAGKHRKNRRLNTPSR